MKKVDKDQSFAAQVKSLCEVAERCMLKNNQIDMFYTHLKRQFRHSARGSKVEYGYCH